MHASFGRPFPRLLAEGNGAAAIRVREDQKGLILRRPSYDASIGYAVVFDRSAAAVIESPDVHWNGQDGQESPSHWNLRGALYVTRYGRDISAERAGEIFDFLLARHMSVGA
jgi:hypothetical protein